MIDGHKWYITGVDGAAFAIVMVRTSDDADPRRGATMFLVDAGTPGFEIVRHVPSLDRTFPGGHCEVRFTNCRVPSDAILGEADFGFDYAQSRLVPARLTHCMRWLGIARRSLEIAAEHAVTRTGGGKALGEHQMVQAMLADSQIDLDASRLLIWRACWELDQGRPAEAKARPPRCSSPRPSTASWTARSRSAAPSGSARTCRSACSTARSGRSGSTTARARSTGSPSPGGCCGRRSRG